MPDNLYKEKTGNNPEIVFLLKIRIDIKTRANFDKNPTKKTEKTSANNLKPNTCKKV